MHTTPAPRPVTQEEAPTAGQWHAVDFSDVAVTASALEGIKSALRSILPHHVPQTALKGITVADSLALFAQRLFWEEGSGRLLLCSEISNRRYCLDIPAGQWQLRVPGQVH